MIQVGRFTFKPWLKGLAACPRTPGLVALIRTFHANRPAELLSIQPAHADVRLRDAGAGCNRATRFVDVSADHGASVPRQVAQSDTAATCDFEHVRVVRELSREIVAAEQNPALIGGRPNSRQLSNGRVIRRARTAFAKNKF